MSNTLLLENNSFLEVYYSQFQIIKKGPKRHGVDIVMYLNEDYYRDDQQNRVLSLRLTQEFPTPQEACAWIESIGLTFPNTSDVVEVYGDEGKLLTKWVAAFHDEIEEEDD